MRMIMKINVSKKMKIRVKAKAKNSKMKFKMRLRNLIIKKLEEVLLKKKIEIKSIKLSRLTIRDY